MHVATLNIGENLAFPGGVGACQDDLKVTNADFSLGASYRQGATLKGGWD